MSNDADTELDSRLLGMLLCYPGPARILHLAIATGFALAFGLRKHPDVIKLLTDSSDACDAACRLVLKFWVARGRADGVEEYEFAQLMADVIRVTRAS